MKQSEFGRAGLLSVSKKGEGQVPVAAAGLGTLCLLGWSSGTDSSEKSRCKSKTVEQLLCSHFAILKIIV